jgi:hypothetical protein
MVKAATKSTRKAAIASLREARKTARAAASEELVRISELDASLRRDARALTTCFWGSYLGIEAAHQQARSAPLYDDDAITPSDPHFVRWTGTPKPTHEYARLPESGEGQLGVQLQGGLATRDALKGHDSRVRLVIHDVPYGTLWLRVGSDGRDPVWAQWPIKMHRWIPDAASWKWVRVSVRHEGRREVWSCEITVDDPAPRPRELDMALDGAIAIEWEWSETPDGIRVARWADTRGKEGVVTLPSSLIARIQKSSDIRAVRDITDNDFRERIQREIQSQAGAPSWLSDEVSTLHLWKSPRRLYRLIQRWGGECPMWAPNVLAKLREWRKRDEHLWDYEACERGQILRRRRDWYRCLAAKWGREYRHALLSDQDLSREAKFGPNADIRFRASPAELRQCIRNVFGDDAIDAKWRDGEVAEEDAREWCERTRDAWGDGGARGDGRFAGLKEKTVNAWAKRKEKGATKRLEKETAREASTNVVE